MWDEYLWKKISVIDVKHSSVFNAESLSTNTLFKIKVPKGWFPSGAIEEPFLVLQKFLKLKMNCFYEKYFKNLKKPFPERTFSGMEIFHGF